MNFVTMGLEPGEGIVNWLRQKGRNLLGSGLDVPQEPECFVTLALATEDIQKGDIILIDLCHGQARCK